tara:strand:+ start:60 stop:344 length:285 start_codon:yes stop_codon:yes gene_type:complete
MGRMTAVDLATNDYGVDVSEQIRLHLVGNHYPPIPESMVPVCIAAIDAVNDYGDWDTELELPNGAKWRGSTTAPAHAIIEGHHLEPWLIESELD